MEEEGSVLVFLRSEIFLRAARSLLDASDARRISPSWVRGRRRARERRRGRAAAPRRRERRVADVVDVPTALRAARRGSTPRVDASSGARLLGKREKKR